MALPLSRLLLSLHIFFFFIPLLLVIITSSPLHPLCIDDESYALLQFKRSFLIKKKTSSDPFSYSKVTSWRHERDCCSWDDVECDEDTGHVIGLDLSGSYLYGSINSNSSLFRLIHLQRLNLADNHFNYSQIPSAVHHLSRLRYLNLSRSSFYGQIPLEILKLSKLASLDLSLNVDYSGNSLLELKTPNLRRLVQNLTSLEELQLSYVQISSAAPDVLANLTYLRSLILESCGLHGTFPIRVFQLPNLQFLNLWNNQDVSGYLPELLQSTSPLKTLRLGFTNFSGSLPESIGNLNSLTEFDIKFCMFSGLVTSSIGNLTKLTYLRLSSNNFRGEIPPSMANLTELTHMSLSRNNLTFGNLSWLGSLTKLTYLRLLGTNLVSDIPYSLRNLTQLQYLGLGHNQLSGQIPFWLSNLTQLTFVSLQLNQLHGPIPKSISTLINLEVLYLAYNHLSGTVKFSIFHDLKNLKTLHLSGNRFSLLTKVNRNSTLPKYKWLGLGECNLSKFPDFLQYQDELEFLELYGNNIHGQIPDWIWNTSKDSLGFIGLFENILTGTIPSAMVSQLNNLQVLNLQDNKLQGPIPIPSFSVTFYDVSSNMFSGDISPLICKSYSLEIIDLSHNNLSGTLPQCSGNLSNLLKILNLKNNSFHGSIPFTFPKRSELRMIDLSQNHLKGSLPKSLANCTWLESLDLSDNQINDNFPFWLGSLPKLQVFGLRNNKFCGAIGSPLTDFEFPMLGVIDLSRNYFEGNLPYGYFHIWNNMKLFEVDHLTYMKFDLNFVLSNFSFTLPIFFSINLTKAGVQIRYSKISKIIVAIDLSSNRFNGEIPESIGSLKMLRLLNLSNNCLTGRIPSSLGNLTGLDSLDLSLNNLIGEIPPQLTQITSLGFLNVSHNHPFGSIPQGKQFDTFENSSYEGNSGLCGKPLSKMCGNSETSPPPNSTFEGDYDSSSPIDFNWMIISMGYGSGLIVGVVIGQYFTTRKHGWFMKTFGRRKTKRKRKRRGQ